MQVTPLELDALVDQRVKKALEGEVVFKEKDCPKYHYPISDWHPKNRVGQSAWLTFNEIMAVDPMQRPSARLLAQHCQKGGDVSGVKAEVDAVYLLAETLYRNLDMLRGVFENLDKRGLNIRFG